MFFLEAVVSDDDDDSMSIETEGATQYITHISPETTEIVRFFRACERDTPWYVMYLCVQRLICNKK